MVLSIKFYLAFLYIVVNSLCGAGAAYRGYKVMRVLPTAGTDLQILKQAGDIFQLNFWKEPKSVGSPVDFCLPPGQLRGVTNFLKTRGILNVEVDIRDLQILIDEQLHRKSRREIQGKASSRNLANFDYSNYHTPEEMLQNPAHAHMMDDVDWFLVPMINIDGYVETWTGDRLWRKTRSTGSSSGCVGTDANRNWDAYWSHPGASPEPCSLAFYGPTAFSESEIRHLANYVLGFGAGNIQAYVSTHSYFEMILYPYGYTDAPSEHEQLLNTVGKLMSDAIRGVHGKDYIYGPVATTVYFASGATSDWTYDTAKVNLSYTYELRDRAEYKLLLPPEQIIPNGEEYLAGLVALKNYVAENFHGA